MDCNGQSISHFTHPWCPRHRFHRRKLHVLHSKVRADKHPGFVRRPDKIYQQSATKRCEQALEFPFPSLYKKKEPVSQGQTTRISRMQPITNHNKGKNSALFINAGCFRRSHPPHKQNRSRPNQTKRKPKQNWIVALLLLTQSQKAEKQY
jgi:hypothetical protein